MASNLNADGAITTHRRSWARALRQWIWPIIGDFPRESLRAKLPRFLIAGARYTWYAILLRRMRTTEGAGVAKSTLRHNLRGMMDLHVERSIRLIYPIVAYAATARADVRDWKLLTIGPRTEGEIFNLVGHGFRRSNITALDLITYSPWIELGDMHAMSYPDATFDVAMAGWVLSYSDEKQRAADEIARVTKPGGIVAIGIEWGRQSPEEIAATRTGYIVGSATRLPTVDAILALFGDRVDRVYFRSDDQDILPIDRGDLVVIFRLRKPTASDHTQG